MDPRKPEQQKEKESTSRPHYYRLSFPVCKKGEEGCTLGNVYEQLLRSPAPGAYRDTAVEDGSKTDVYGLGPVEHTVDRENRTVTNKTTPTHRLHPGQVTHKVQERGDYVEIETTGTGTGPYPWVNEMLSSPLWNWHIGGIKDKVRDERTKDEH